MIYKRSFELHCAHFNNEEAYEAAREFMARVSQRAVTLEASEAFAKAALATHGHNFIVIVEAEKELKFRQSSWLVDDVVLAEKVEEWQDCNLSLHADFFKDDLRATTENMARVLAAKLNGAFPDCRWVVEVQETKDISAKVTI